PASRHTKVTLIFLPPRSVFSTFAPIRNAGVHVSPEESSASFYRSAAILLRQIARGAETLSRWMDLRRAPGYAWLQRRSAPRFSARERFRYALRRGRPDRYLVAAPWNLLA